MEDGRGVLADVEDGRVRLPVDHALAGEDEYFVLAGQGGERWGCAGAARFAPRPTARGALGSRGCISMLDELQSANV